MPARGEGQAEAPETRVLQAMSDAVLAIAAEMAVEPILQKLVQSRCQLVDGGAARARPEP